MDYSIFRTVTCTAIVVPPEYRLSPTWKHKDSSPHYKSPSHVSCSSDTSSLPEIVHVTPTSGLESDQEVETDVRMVMRKHQLKTLQRQDTNNCSLVPSSFKLETRDLVQEREFRQDSAARLVAQEKTYHQPKGVIGRYLEPIVKMRLVDDFQILYLRSSCLDND